MGCSPWGRTESDTTEETQQQQQQQEYESASIGEHSCQHLILSNFCFEGPFNFSHSSGTTVISHWILNSIFLVTEHLFILGVFFTHVIKNRCFILLREFLCFHFFLIILL